MNEDAFARRFYADRSELEALRHPALGREAGRRPRRAGELLAARRRTSTCPPIEFTDEELAALADRAARCSTASSPTPSRCASRCSRSPGAARARSARPSSSTVALGITGSAGGHELSQRLAKIETAIFRRKTIVFDYYTMERDEVGARKVDPYQLLFQGGQFYLVGHSHERDAIRVFRLSRIRGKVAYATKAEHDFQRPADFDPRAYANRIDWQFGEPVGHRRGLDRRAGSPGRSSATSAATARCARPSEDGDRVFVTPYANARQLIAWVLGLGEHARILGPPELADELARARRRCCVERHTRRAAARADGRARAAAAAGRRADADGRRRQRPPPRRPRSAPSASRGW